MNLKYLKKLRPILNKVGKKHGIPTNEGEFIIDEFFKSFRDALTDPRIPRVRLPMFGTFNPTISSIRRSLSWSIKFHRAGGTTREYINARIKRIWPIRNRICEEKLGMPTWKKWRGKEVKEEFEKLVINEQEEKRKSKEAIYGTNSNRKESRDFFREVQKRLQAQNRKSRKS